MAGNGSSNSGFRRFERLSRPKGTDGDNVVFALALGVADDNGDERVTLLYSTEYGRKGTWKGVPASHELGGIVTRWSTFDGAFDELVSTLANDGFRTQAEVEAETLDELDSLGF